MEEWKPVDRPETELITIGWAGAPVNIPNIERLEPVLVHILDKYPNVRLAIFSGKKPVLRCHYQHHPFQPGGEPEFMHSIDIGLLPLVDEEYSKGKSPIKAIQYAACGLPVVGNIFGATEEILNAENSIEVRNTDEWIAGLEKIIENPVLRRKMGTSGRKYISQRHSIEVTSQKLIDIILGLTG